MAARPGRHSGARPAATIISDIWINPNHPDIILLVSDQGAIVSVNGGADLELLVQPADRADVPRRTPTTHFRTASAAASRRAARPASRAAATTAQITFREWHPVGVEEYGYAVPDPLEPEHRVWRQADPVRPPHGAGAEDRAQADSHVGLSRRAHAAGRLLAGRSARALLRDEHALEDDRRRPISWKRDQPRPDAQDVGCAGERRQVPRRRTAEADAARRHLRASRHRRSTSTASGPAPTTG